MRSTYTSRHYTTILHLINPKLPKRKEKSERTAKKCAEMAAPLSYRWLVIKVGCKGEYDISYNSMTS